MQEEKARGRKKETLTAAIIPVMDVENKSVHLGLK